MLFSVQLHIVLVVLIGNTRSIWPPPYQIHLDHSEDFVIFESFGDEDSDRILSEEDEMIKQPNISSLDFSKDSAKYLRIHKLAMKLGKRSATTEPAARKIKWPEENYEQEENQPWIAGYFAENGTNVLSDNSNVYYLNEMAKMQVEFKEDEKRSQRFINQDYDYTKLKQEYDSEMKKAQGENDTLDFVDVKEEETVKDMVKNLVNFTKTPRNCTAEEVKGIGLNAVECFWYDFTKVDTKESRIVLYKRILKLILIWALIYILVAVPCWCQKGWCCCCFQCRFCKPKLRIDEVKKFMADNPPGTYHTGDKVLKYKPTHYEKYAQKRLEQTLVKL